MSKRLQVIMPDREFDELRRTADRHGTTVSEWDRTQRLLDEAIFREQRLLTSAEILQEILHRYGALDRLEAIRPAFDVLLAVVDEVPPVDLAAVQIAKRIMMGRLGLSARDAVHVAVMEQEQAVISQIMSFDTEFDVYPGVERLSEQRCPTNECGHSLHHLPTRP